MMKISRMQKFRKKSLKGCNLTIGVDLGDRSRSCCMLDESGEVLKEHQLETTSKSES